jgi:hypothetical protein
LKKPTAVEDTDGTSWKRSSAIEIRLLPRSSLPPADAPDHAAKATPATSDTNHTPGVFMRFSPWGAQGCAPPHDGRR